MPYRIVSWVYIRVILGLYWGYIGVILGLYWVPQTDFNMILASGPAIVQARVLFCSQSYVAIIRSLACLSLTGDLHFDIQQEAEIPLLLMDCLHQEVKPSLGCATRVKGLGWIQARTH